MSGTRVSVVVETNQHDAESSISLGQVLDVLRGQTYPRELVEVVVVVESGADALVQLVEAHLPGATIVRTDDGAYYPMKVRGAAAATGDVIAFLDSDTTPEPDWIERLVAVIEGGADVSVASMRYEPGRRLVRFRSLLDWGHVHAQANGEATSLLSNSVAFRRAVWERHPFDPTLRRTGACYLLARQLRSAGYSLAFDPGQRILHRDCYVGRQFVFRRLRSGYDAVLVGRRDRATPEARALKLGPLAPAALFAGRLMFDLKTLVRHRREFDVRPAEVPLFALGLAGARSLEALAAAVTMIRPSLLAARLEQ